MIDIFTCVLGATWVSWLLLLAFTVATSVTDRLFKTPLVGKVLPVARSHVGDLLPPWKLYRSAEKGRYYALACGLMLLAICTNLYRHS